MPISTLRRRTCPTCQRPNLDKTLAELKRIFLEAARKPSVRLIRRVARGASVSSRNPKCPSWGWPVPGGAERGAARAAADLVGVHKGGGLGGVPSHKVARELRGLAAGRDLGDGARGFHHARVCDRGRNKARGLGGCAPSLRHCFRLTRHPLRRKSAEFAGLAAVIVIQFACTAMLIAWISYFLPDMRSHDGRPGNPTINLHEYDRFLTDAGPCANYGTVQVSICGSTVNRVAFEAKIK